MKNYTEHSKIEITSNADFAAQKIAENWTGKGLEEDPYIIQGYNITHNGHNIRIVNVTVHFEIRDCLLISSSSMPRIDDYDNGIAIENSSNGAILYNEILGGRDSGVYIGWSNISLIGNLFSQFDYLPSYRGIIFYFSSGSASYNGIRHHEQDGIWISNSSHVDLESNVIMGGNMGISILHSSQVTVADNDMTNGAGIWMHNVESSSVARNVITDDFDSGITVSNSRLSSIYQNSILYGVGDGIVVDSSSECTYTGNEIIQCQNGFLVYSSSYSTFSYNYVVSSWEIGFNLIYGENNDILGNLFANNFQAYDGGVDNKWDDGARIGNYWSNHQGFNPVSIDGANSEDHFPLQIIPTDVLLPSISGPPSIRKISEDVAILTWVIWSTPGTYLLFRNGTQIESGLWPGSGSIQVFLYDLTNGTYEYRLLVSDSSNQFAASIAIIQAPDFSILNDNDRDEMYDVWELENALDPQNPIDASEDFDSDGLTNLAEFNLGTNPHNADSDGDMIPDLWEFQNGFDPTDGQVPPIEFLAYFRPYIIGIPSGIIVLLGSVA
ncbi:MAG: NosD domain-containing protein, partial [Candidatus Thorarchaeota archaeon]